MRRLKKLDDLTSIILSDFYVQFLYSRPSFTTVNNQMKREQATKL